MEFGVAKQKLTSKRHCQITTLEEEREDALSERDSLKDQLEVVTTSLNLLKDEYTRRTSSDFSIAAGDSNYQIDQQSESMSLSVSDSESAVVALTQELADANERITFLMVADEGQKEEIVELEQRICEQDEEIAEFQKQLALIGDLHGQEMAELVDRHEHEIADWRGRLMENKAHAKQIQRGFEKVTGELDEARAESARLQAEIDASAARHNTAAAAFGSFAAPSGMSSPIARQTNRSQGYSLYEELLSSSEKLEAELRAEKQKYEDVKVGFCPLDFIYLI